MRQPVKSVDSISATGSEVRGVGNTKVQEYTKNNLEAVKIK